MTFQSSLGVVGTDRIWVLNERLQHSTGGVAKGCRCSEGTGAKPSTDNTQTAHVAMMTGRFPQDLLQEKLGGGKQLEASLECLKQVVGG